ncbi:hypothetical protein [Lacticaseibacillus daqingensis]|uniref:hypothetical protein n=1 Tax=Lacticaseibacillus daqingensis TaxID=2486014 RepID=UPI000F79E592|nr:hypothetical protein [Lacticaseibacillus daqingensis]
MAEIKTRKAYRQAQHTEETEAAARDAKRRSVEREYAKENRAHPTTGRFDEVTYKRVNSLKKKLNWAIGIVIVLIALVAGVLFWL